MNVSRAAPDNRIDDLSAYLDGELSPRDAESVREFLAQSEEARALLRELRKVRAQLRQLPRVSPPAPINTDALAADWDRQRARAALSERPAVGLSRTIRIYARIGSAAAVVLACTWVGWIALQSNTPARHGAAPQSAVPPVDLRRPAVVERSPKRGPIVELDAADLRALEALGYVGDAASESELDDLVAIMAPDANEQPDLTAITAAPIAGEPLESPATVGAPLVAAASGDESLGLTIHISADTVDQATEVAEFVDGFMALNARSFAKASARGGGGGAQRQAAAELQIAQLAPLMDELERHAGQRVEVQMAFRPDQIDEVEAITEIAKAGRRSHQPAAAPPAAALADGYQIGGRSTLRTDVDAASRVAVGEDPAIAEQPNEVDTRAAKAAPRGLRARTPDWNAAAAPLAFDVNDDREDAAKPAAEPEPESVFTDAQLQQLRDGYETLQETPKRVVRWLAPQFRDLLGAGGDLFGLQDDDSATDQARVAGRWIQVNIVIDAPTGSPSPSSGAEPRDDAERLKMLESLGYVGGGDDPNRKPDPTADPNTLL